MSTVDLGYRPRPWQQLAHERRCRFSVLVLHRRAGKTEWALRQLLDDALRSTVDLALYAYVAPLRTQAKAIAWARLKQVTKRLVDVGAAEISESDLSITLISNGAVVRLFGADNPDSMRGLRFDGVVLDEVAQMRPEVWDEVVFPALTDRQGYGVFIGTVKGIDLFSSVYYRGLARMQAGDPLWWVGLWTVHQTDALMPSEVALAEASMSEKAWRREMLCDFGVQGDDQLIGYSDARAASARVYMPGDVVHAPRIIGVDPARFGDDRSVIVKRQGLVMLDPIVLRDVDQMDLAARVAFEIQDWRPDAVFIDTGLGAGVIDRLRQMGHDPIEVPFGGTALKAKRFLNRRSEMWWGVREWLQAGGKIPDDVVLQQELATPTYTFNSKGQIELESKADIRKRLPDAGSPDVADALALTFAAPVVPKRHVPDEAWPKPGVPLGEKWRESGRTKEWNPYARAELHRRGRR